MYASTEDKNEQIEYEIEHPIDREDIIITTQNGHPIVEKKNSIHFHQRSGTRQ